MRTTGKRIANQGLVTHDGEQYCTGTVKNAEMYVKADINVFLVLNMSPDLCKSLDSLCFSVGISIIACAFLRLFPASASSS